MGLNGNGMKEYLNRLIPAANATAIVAAVVHVVSLGLTVGGMGFEAVYIAVFTYIICLVAAIVVGGILLCVVERFKLGLLSALLLFLAVAQLAVIVITMYLFEFKFTNIPSQYFVISISPTITAWYFSVYYVRKNKLS